MGTRRQDLSVDDCRLIELPKIMDVRGNLTFLEGGNHIPFPIKRVFYVYDIPSGADRGAHAHYDLHQFIVCLSGGLQVSLDDGKERRKVGLNRPWVGLHVPPMIWAWEGDFHPGTVYVVLASDVYRADSYIRDYDEFVREVRRRE
jgi:hypothetical protein